MLTTIPHALLLYCPSKKEALLVEEQSRKEIPMPTQASQLNAFLYDDRNLWELMMLGFTKVGCPTEGLSELACMFGMLLDNESPEYIDSWSFPETPGRNGIIIREPPKDDKTYLHYRPRLPRLLSERGVLVDRYGPLLEGCRNCYWRYTNLLCSFIRDFAGHDPRLRALRNTEVDERSTLRIIRYNNAGKSKRATIAAPHFDISAFSSSLWENYGGLEYSTPTGNQPSRKVPSECQSPSHAGGIQPPMPPHNHYILSINKNNALCRVLLSRSLSGM